MSTPPANFDAGGNFEQALTVGRQLGHPQTSQVEALLRQFQQSINHPPGGFLPIDLATSDPPQLP